MLYMYIKFIYLICFLEKFLKDLCTKYSKFQFIFLRYQNFYTIQSVVIQYAFNNKNNNNNDDKIIRYYKRNIQASLGRQIVAVVDVKPRLQTLVQTFRRCRLTLLTHTHIHTYTHLVHAPRIEWYRQIERRRSTLSGHWPKNNNLEFTFLNTMTCHNNLQLQTIAIYNFYVIIHFH